MIVGPVPKCPEAFELNEPSMQTPFPATTMIMSYQTFRRGHFCLGRVFPYRKSRSHFKAGDFGIWKISNAPILRPNWYQSHLHQHDLFSALSFSHNIISAYFYFFIIFFFLYHYSKPYHLNNIFALTFSSSWLAFSQQDSPPLPPPSQRTQTQPCYLSWKSDCNSKLYFKWYCNDIIFPSQWQR